LFGDLLRPKHLKLFEGIVANDSIPTSSILNVIQKGVKKSFFRRTIFEDNGEGKEDRGMSDFFVNLVCEVNLPKIGKTVKDIKAF